MSVLDIVDVSHAYGPKKVLNQVNLRVGAGQIMALIGPSGCGKSTLLRAVLGTHPPTFGQILVGDCQVTAPNRDVGIVYQHYSLYDFLTARENVAFGLKLDQTSTPFRVFNYFGWRKLRKQHLEQADDFLQKVGLGAARDMYPNQMSGGMRQRVAIAQALIMQPKILLLDEPFGALDEAMREELQLMLLQLYAENVQAREENRTPPHTIVMVTHELNEALFVSDRVVGLSQYHADGANGATIVYDRPAPVFKPDEPKDISRFVEQKEELIRCIFSAQFQHDHLKFVTFWDELEKQHEEAAGSP
ncbi:ABC transporter ATP-binding protein [Blastopirellula retiformator]|uniref:Sulfate/thiosulfate import ATP-binding protein CysA n=1 Tax=Blastopirellula retiformator TaxID=2527970 RepID=A0A5C5UWI4_9BACT|nr:ATP-binding cassette domain-containing protein [Blastopirellula retiformator]TWT29725.1 Sulfate/thiosulfate import ATP-binding protein CysA [Blastopirellula retiformator]